MNIQRYKIADITHLHPDKDGEICMFVEVEAKEKYITALRGCIKNRDVSIGRLEEAIAEQAKEIERLKAAIKEVSDNYCIHDIENLLELT